MAPLALLAMVACVSSVPRQTMPPVTPPPVVAAPAAVQNAWPIVPSALSREFSIDQRAVFTTTTDSGTTSDSTSLVVEFSFRRTADGGGAGLLRSAMLGAPGVAAVPFPGLLPSIAFLAPPSARGVMSVPAVRGVRPDPCGSPADVPLTLVRDLLIQVPDTLRIGTTWSDSGSFDTCRDGAVITMSSRRTFRARQFVSDTAGGVFLVERTSRTALRGTAVRGDDTTRIEGAGSATMNLRLDARNGGLIGGEGTSELELTVRGRTKTERARQTGRARVSLILPRGR